MTEIMSVKVAIKARIEQLCNSQGLSINALAKNADLTASTVYSLLNEQSQNPGIVTIEAVCKGLGISVKEFFDSPLFGKK